MSAPRTTPAAFLDRDGILIEDRGYLRSPSGVVFLPDAARAQQLLQHALRLFIVTGQGSRRERSYGIDLQASFVIGDHPHDVELAREAGATGICVLTGHGAGHRAELQSEALMGSGIWEAANWVVKMDHLRRSQESLGTGICPT